MAERTTETAQTLDRGLRLLHLVADSPAGLSVTEAATSLGVGRAVIYRLAATLSEHAMIRRDAHGRLRLGTGILHLANRAEPLIADAARPVLRRLAESLGATAHLTVADGTEAVALAVVEPSWTDLHVAYRTGTRHPLDRGAAGRAIIAGRRGEHSLAATSGELQSGAHGIAAPVLGVEDLEASVGVIALAPLDAERVGPAVLAAAAAIATALS
ncbi:MAG TPA: helix-turn-helix domain-containing protein [Micromonosporaceae bacterium]|nr:helix-turn-helix domain-containing protein [Micromonosporaceae bacterium]